VSGNSPHRNESVAGYSASLVSRGRLLILSGQRVSRYTSVGTDAEMLFNFKARSKNPPQLRLHHAGRCRNCICVATRRCLRWRHTLLRTSPEVEAELRDIRRIICSDQAPIFYRRTSYLCKKWPTCKVLSARLYGALCVDSYFLTSFVSWKCLIVRSGLSIEKRLLFGTFEH
jgi:hypothetical protein